MGDGVVFFLDLLAVCILLRFGFDFGVTSDVEKDFVMVDVTCETERPHAESDPEERALESTAQEVVS